MFLTFSLVFLTGIGCAAYAGSHYGAKAGAEVVALKAKLAALEASIKAKL